MAYIIDGKRISAEIILFSFVKYSVTTGPIIPIGLLHVDIL